MAENTALVDALETAHVSWRGIGPGDPEFEIDGVAPELLVEPATGQELASALGAAGDASLRVIPRGGGSQLGLGNPPSGGDVLVSTLRLDRVLEHEPANLTVTVEAGLPLARLQSALAEHGQFLPLDPPSAERSTIGGIVATNASGPRRLGYGSVRDLLIGLRVATPGGKLVRSGGKVVKNVAGYDLNKLYVGSLGTLGILTELTFKLSPRPSAEATLVAAFSDVAAASEAVREILRSTLQPIAVELLNAEAAGEVGLRGLVGDGGCVLAVLVGGVAPAVRRQVGDLGQIVGRAGASAREEVGSTTTLWTEVANLIGREDRTAVRCKASVPPAAVPGAWAALSELGSVAGRAPTLWAHAGSGIVYVRWPAVSDGASASVGEPLTERTVRALLAARREIQARDGSLVVEAAPLDLKNGLAASGADVWGYVGDALDVMRAVKAQLDPKGVLNPGRFVGGI